MEVLAVSVCTWYPKPWRFILYQFLRGILSLENSQKVLEGSPGNAHPVHFRPWRVLAWISRFRGTPQIDQILKEIVLTRCISGPGGSWDAFQDFGAPFKSIQFLRKYCSSGAFPALAAAGMDFPVPGHPSKVLAVSVCTWYPKPWRFILYQFLRGILSLGGSLCISCYVVS